MIDFDSIDDWAPKLGTALSPHLPRDFQERMRSAKPEYIEDARRILLGLGGRDTIIDETLRWIRSETLVAYHGSRLTDDELRSIRDVGLAPLQATNRRARLVRALSRDGRWLQVEHKLDDAIQQHGAGEKAGRREGQVHLTLSKSGLKDGFNHYLMYGSEYDQHVAHSLFGDEGYALLSRDGTARLISVAVSGDVALSAAHPHFTVDDVREMGDVPNVVSEFLEGWAFQIANPGFQVATLKVDCGLVFREPVPAAQIIDVETLPA